MLSEGQWNIFVELTLAGWTAQYITDRFDCSISTIWRIRQKGVGELVDGKDCQVAVVQRRLQLAMSAISEGLSCASDFAHWPKSHRSFFMVKQSTAKLLYKIRTLVSRTRSDEDDGVPAPLTGQYQTFGLAYFSVMNQGSTLHIVTEGMENSRVKIYTRIFHA